VNANLIGGRRAAGSHVRSGIARRPQRVLAGLELSTGATAVLGGVLLASLVSGGYLLTGVWQARSGARASVTARAVLAPSERSQA
jgi:hypothetical protein